MFGAHMMTTEGPTQIRYKRKCLPPFQASRLETRVVLEALFDRCPGLRLDPERPTAPYGYEFRKPRRLFVLWDGVSA